MKYIFWDFNGTILDDLLLCFNILNEMLIKHERKTVTLEEYRMIFDFPVETYYGQVFDLDQTPFPMLAHEFMEKYQKQSLKIELHEDVTNAIKYAHFKQYKNVLLSASEISRLTEQIQHYEIEYLFDDVLGTSTIYAKSKLDVFKSYIKENAINPKDVLIIGDTSHDAELGEAIGCNVILYTQGHQHESRLNKYKTINHFSELIDII